MKRTIIIGILFLCSTLIAPHAHASNENVVDVYLFWSSGCPHCAKERYFLSKLEQREKNIVVHEYEIGSNPANAELLIRTGQALNADVRGVPFAVVGQRAFIGFLNEETTGKEIERAIRACEASYCHDVVGAILGNPPRPKPTPGPVEPPTSAGTNSEEADTEQNQLLPNAPPIDAEQTDELETKTNGYLKQSVKEHPIPETIYVPLFGAVKIKNFSLPAITIVFGAIDGFNPCAMWVLLFLISLLIGMENRRRMWALGTIFIVSSAIVYFLFMAAWLNALLFFGLLFWVRAGIATLAIAAGGYHIRSYIFKPGSGCEIVSDDKRQRMFSRIREIVGRKAFWFAMLGIIGLAFAVNLIELLCSAGLPVVYTQILTMTNLQTWQYYAYLLLYITIFMLDDLFVFIIAMKTLQMVGITTKYTRITRLIGGIVMITIGILLFMKPEWLMFG